MKLILKNLKQVTYDIEVPSEKTTILELKKEIEKTYNFDASQIKLLLKGSILNDEKTLEDYKIQDGDTIILMATKIKIKNIDAKPQTTEEKKEENKEEKKDEKKPEEKTQETNKYTSQLNSLIEMGYDKTKAEAAIKAAQGQIDLAVDYIMNGIPENIKNNSNPLFGAQEQGEGQGQSEGEEDEETDPLKKAASIFKIVCQNNPVQLNNLLQSVAQSDPDLFSLIQERQEEFKNLLEQPISEEDQRNFRNYQREMGFENAGHGQHGGQGAIRINLTPEDREVINRLKDLGNFNEADVVQAYFACDKNEEMTANYLFEHMYGNQGNNQ